MKSIDDIQPYARGAGITLAGVSCVMTMIFAWSLGSHWTISAFLAVALGIASLSSAFIWSFVATWVEDRRYFAAGVAALGGLIFTGTDLTSNFGAIAWQRDSNVQQASVQNIKYDDSREQVAENRANLQMWKDQLAKLQAENAWAATVTPDGLQAQIRNMEGDQVFRRSRECSNVTLRDSRDFCDRLADLRNRVAVATRVSDLTKRIEATQRLVDNYRERAATVEKSESAALMQTIALASVATISLDPTQEAIAWTSRAVAWWVAAFLTFGSAILIYVATRRLRQSAATTPAATPLVPAGNHTTSIVRVTDEAIARWAERNAPKLSAA